MCKLSKANNSNKQSLINTKLLHLENEKIILHYPISIFQSL